eukprot:scaffold7600_cov76-Isochrysis_galbana.AAC.3
MPCAYRSVALGCHLPAARHRSWVPAVPARSDSRVPSRPQPLHRLPDLHLGGLGALVHSL